MDVCDPNASIKELRDAVRRNTGLDDIKLTREQICDIKSRVEGGLILAPPLMLSADRKFMRDPKSPFSRSDYEKLFRAETKRSSLMRLAKKIRIAIDEESATKEQIADAIHSKLRLMKISEPIELAKRTKKRRRVARRANNRPTNSAMENSNNKELTPPRPTRANVNNVNTNNRPTPSPQPTRANASVNNNNNNNNTNKRPTPQRRRNNVAAMNNRPSPLPRRAASARPDGKSFFERLFGGNEPRSFEVNSRRLMNAKRQMNARENAFEIQKRETQRKMNNMRDASEKIKRERDRYDDELKYLRRQQYSSNAERKAKEQQIALVQQKLRNSELKLEMSEQSKDNLKATLNAQKKQIDEANAKIEAEKRKMQEQLKQETEKAQREIEKLQEQLSKGVDDPNVKKEYERKLSEATSAFEEKIQNLERARVTEREGIKTKLKELQSKLVAAQDSTEKNRLEKEVKALQVELQEALRKGEKIKLNFNAKLREVENSVNKRKQLEEVKQKEAETKLSELANQGKFDAAKIPEALLTIGANTDVDKFVKKVADKANKRREETALKALRQTGVDDAYIRAYMNARNHGKYSDVNVNDLTNKRDKDMIVAKQRANIAPRGFFGGKQKPKLVYIANDRYNEALSAINQAKAQKENAQQKAQEEKENAQRKAQEEKEAIAAARQKDEESLKNTINLTNEERKRIMKKWRPGFDLNKAVNAVRAKKLDESKRAEALEKKRLAEESNRNAAEQALRNIEDLTNAERATVMKKWKPGYDAMAQAQKIVTAKKSDEQALMAMNITNNERANIMRRWKYGSWTFDARKEGQKIISEKEKKHIKNLRATVGGRSSKAGQWKEKDIRRVAQKLGKDVRALTVNDLREANAEEKQALSNATAAKNANQRAREKVMKNSGNERVLTERATAIRNKIIRTRNITNAQKDKLVNEIGKNLRRPKRARKWLDDAEIDKRLAKLRSDAKALELAQRLGVTEKFVRETAGRVGKPVYNLIPANVTTQKQANPEVVANKAKRNADKQKKPNSITIKKRENAKKELSKLAERGLFNRTSIPKAIATITANTDMRVFIKQFERRQSKPRVKTTASENNAWRKKWNSAQEQARQANAREKKTEANRLEAEKKKEAARLRAEKAERAKKEREEAESLEAEKKKEAARLKAELKAKEQAKKQAKKEREEAERLKRNRELNNIFERVKDQFNIHEQKFVDILEADRKKYKTTGYAKKTLEQISDAITKKWQGIKKEEAIAAARQKDEDSLKNTINLTNEERKRIMKKWRPGFDLNKAVNAVRTKKAMKKKQEAEKKEKERLKKAKRQEAMKNKQEAKIQEAMKKKPEIPVKREVDRGVRKAVKMQATTRTGLGVKRSAEFKLKRKSVRQKGDAVKRVKKKQEKQQNQTWRFE